MHTSRLSILFAAAVMLGVTGLATAEEASRAQIVIDGAVYQRTKPAGPFDKFINLGGGGVGATCVSGNGQKVCACGDKACIAGGESCGCIVATPPPTPTN